MKNQAFIGEEYRKACRYCEWGSLSFDETAVLCPKKGVMGLEDLCKRFVYDPLKYTPMQAALPQSAFTSDDFAL